MQLDQVIQQNAAASEEIKRSIDIGATAWLLKSSKTNDKLMDVIDKII